MASGKKSRAKTPWVSRSRRRHRAVADWRSGSRAGGNRRFGSAHGGADLSRGGHLVAASRGELEVVSTEGGCLSHFGRAAEFKHDPLAILPLPDASRFAVLTAEGLVTIYEVPS